MPPPKRNKEYQKKTNVKDPKGVILASSFSGPLPPPNILMGYEKTCPGAADRIIKMAETQTKHRQKLEKSVVGSNIDNEKVGMWMAFILTVGLMCSGIYLIKDGKGWGGYAAVFLPVIFHAGNYVYNKQKEERVPEKKDK